MLCFLVAYLDKNREIQMSSFEANTNDKNHAVWYILNTLEKRNCINWAVFLLEGSGYTKKEYEKMIDKKSFPPFETVYVAPGLLANYYSLKCSNEILSKLLH